MRSMKVYEHPDFTYSPEPRNKLLLAVEGLAFIAVSTFAAFKFFATTVPAKDSAATATPAPAPL
ncbi:hypothetical protein OE88DRAFT_1659979 [Heliocybe sulcata]|uniref:Uncharacterized protein n=1 Tax=Heliocybe sulcata TaxID=5364 RepID=A0A5C3N124_9AGAM|nr:hypothetical protein OE88DRAFT_1659979 [Heliocybe sulcata]